MACNLYVLSVNRFAVLVVDLCDTTVIGAGSATEAELVPVWLALCLA